MESSNSDAMLTGVSEPVMAVKFADVITNPDGPTVTLMVVVAYPVAVTVRVVVPWLMP